MADPTPADPPGYDYAPAIVETMLGPLLVLSPDLRVLRANRSFYSIFHTVPEQVADRDRLLELISVAESHDANVGRGLRLLAQGFDYRSLLGLLQTGGNE